MEFSMKGVGGVSSSVRVFFFNFLLNNHLESLPDCQNALCYVYIVVEVTLNRAEL